MSFSNKSRRLLCQTKLKDQDLPPKNYPTCLLSKQPEKFYSNNFFNIEMDKETKRLTYNYNGPFQTPFGIAAVDQTEVIKGIQDEGKYAYLDKYKDSIVSMIFGYARTEIFEHKGKNLVAMDRWATGWGEEDKIKIKGTRLVG
jgi:hypothetical protein